MLYFSSFIFSPRHPPSCIFLLLTIFLLISGCAQPQKKATDKPINRETSSAKNQAPSLVADLEKQLERDSNNPELHYKLGFAYAAQAETTKSATDRKSAIREFNKVLQLVPGNENTLAALYNIYYEDVVKGDNASLEKAKAIFNQLSPPMRQQMNPPSLAHFLQLYIEQKNSAEKSSTEKSIDEKSTHSLLDALLTATREQPDGDKAYTQLAKMYRSQGLYPLAIATLKLAESNGVQTQDFLHTLAETYEARAEGSGCAYEHPESLYRAATYYQKAISLAAEKPDLHYQLAQAFIDNNHYQLAINEMDIVLQLSPTAENYAWAAQTWSALGNTQQAFKLLDQARQQGLAESDTAYHEIYMNAGDWMKAALSFTGYLQAQQEISVYDAIKADIIRDQTEWDFSKLTRGKKLAVRNEWEGAVYAYWTEKISRHDFEKAASNRCERTEYYFYSGYRDYRAGKTVEARQNFHAALQQHTFRFIERPLASYFLGRD